jgi:hypothetical protein
MYRWQLNDNKKKFNLNARSLLSVILHKLTIAAIDQITGFNKFAIVGVISRFLVDLGLGPLFYSVLTYAFTILSLAIRAYYLTRTLFFYFDSWYMAM